MNVRNLLRDLPSDLREESFEPLIPPGPVTIERIVSKGHSSPPTGWYDQDRDEWVMLLQGEAILTFEQAAEVHLHPGDSLLIPAHCKHKVAWTPDDRETIWLAVHY